MPRTATPFTSTQRLSALAWWTVVQITFALVQEFARNREA